MAAAGHFGILFPDHLEPIEARRGALDQLRPANHGAGAVARAGFGPAQVNGTALREIGREDHVAEPALTGVENRGNPRDVARGAAFFPEFEFARFFGDEREARSGQEGHRPRLVEGRRFLHREGRIGERGRGLRTRRVERGAVGGRVAGGSGRTGGDGQCGR